MKGVHSMTYLPYIHILLMITAVVLLTVAIIIVRKKRAGWFVLHKRLASMSTLSALTAFIAEFLFKTTLNYPHIKSPHAIAGLATLTLLIITPVIGFQIASNPKFRDIHRALGKITSVAIFLTAIMGILRFIQLLQHK
jgi:hypothetical protein